MKLQRFHKAVIIFLLVVALAAFSRLYKLSDYLHFASDEGRDAFLVEKIINEKNIFVLGPMASFTGFALGPLYYLLMAGGYLLSVGNPVSSAYLVALSNIAAIAMLFWFMNKVFGLRPAFFSTSLFALSFRAVVYSRWSWNPNPLPLFAVLLLVCLYYLARGRRFQCLWVMGVFACLSAMLQLHATAIIFVPILLAWFIIVRPRGIPWYSWFAGAAVFELLYLPILIYDFQNSWSNAQGTLRAALEVAYIPDKWAKLIDVFRQIESGLSVFMGDHTFKQILWAIMILAFIFACRRFWRLWKARRQLSADEKVHYAIWWFWGLTAIFSFIIFYAFTAPVFTHYFSYLAPSLFAILGLWLAHWWGRGKWWRTIAYLAFLFLLTLNVTMLIQQAQALTRGELYRGYGVPWGDQMAAVKYLKEASADRPANYSIVSTFVWDHAMAYNLHWAGVTNVQFLWLTDASYTTVHPENLANVPAAQLFVLVPREDWKAYERNELPGFSLVGSEEFRRIRVYQYQRD